jgi:hypothetical protein
MRFKGPHKFALLLSTADVYLVRPALMFRGPRTEDSVRMVGNPEVIQMGIVRIGTGKSRSIYRWNARVITASSRVTAHLGNNPAASGEGRPPTRS